MGANLQFFSYAWLIHSPYHFSRLQGATAAQAAQRPHDAGNDHWGVGCYYTGSYRGRGQSRRAGSNQGTGSQECYY